jgi:hypothetical protein
MAVVVLHLLVASFVLPQHGLIAPARRSLSVVCQAPTPDVSDGAGEQGDPRGAKPADHRRQTIASQASQAVDSASSSESFFHGSGSIADQVDKRWVRSKKSATGAPAPTPDVSDGAGEQGDPRGAKPADHRRQTIASQASQAVDSASSSQSFFDGPGSMAGQVDLVRATVRVRIS